MKAHLSRYLREIRRGGEVQILDRGVPVARLTGIGAAAQDSDERRDRLIRAGVLRPGSGDASGILRLKPLEISVRLGEALDEERADRV